MFMICLFVVQAEREHDKKTKKKELARQQGEGTWMLPSVDERIKHEEEVTIHMQFLSCVVLLCKKE